MRQRFNEVPKFFLYALAAGIKRAFVRYGSWVTKAVVKKKDDRRIPRRRRREAVVYNYQEIRIIRKVDFALLGRRRGHVRPMPVNIG